MTLLELKDLMNADGGGLSTEKMVAWRRVNAHTSTAAKKVYGGTLPCVKRVKELVLQ